MKKVLKFAFIKTVPILTGYLVLGAAYGFLMSDKGFGMGITVACSLFIYAGSMQYMGIALLTSVFNPVYAFLLTLMINARHLFYGISMLETYRDMHRWKPYLIFGLTDETFSVVCSAEPPKEVPTETFYFCITVLDHLYWVTGTVIGYLLSGIFTFDTTGLDFALTALFVVIFTDQWLAVKKHTPAVIGVVCSVLALLIFGQNNFLIPAMAAIVLCLFLFKKPITNSMK